jgi:predicted DNA-binding transcriptional regulator YafY
MAGTVSDRRVEAYDVRLEDGIVVCFDIDRNDVRVFSINRIGYVEILEEQGWKHASSHRDVKVDVFHMSGDTTIRISLQLVFAILTFLFLFFTGSDGEEPVGRGVSQGQGSCQRSEG